MGLSGADIKTCQDDIANYIPKIMKHIFIGLKNKKGAKFTCKHFFKVCKKPEVPIEQILNPNKDHPGCHDCHASDGCHCSCSGHTCHCRCY